MSGATTSDRSSAEPSSGRPPLETSGALLALGVSKPVFACRWPESRAIADELRRELPGRLDMRLYGEPYAGGQDVMQDEFLRRWLVWSRDVVMVDEGAFPHRYATAGSSEAIRECLAQFAVERWRRDRPPVLHVLHGDYEGYAAVAEGYGIRIERHDRERWRETVVPGRVDAGDLLLISQPSAIDGNLWPEMAAFIRHIEQAAPETRVAVDLAYVGSVAGRYSVDVTSPVIDTVFFSLSKVFGVYYHRIGGVLSRRGMPGLVGTKWFKNTFSLALGSTLLERLPLLAIPTTYRPMQMDLVARLRDALDLPLVASDVILLAHHPWRDDLPSTVASLRRGPAVRYCVTPALDRRLAIADNSATGS